MELCVGVENDPIVASQLLDTFLNMLSQARSNEVPPGMRRAMDDEEEFDIEIIHTIGIHNPILLPTILRLLHLVNVELRQKVG